MNISVLNTSVVIEQSQRSKNSSYDQQGEFDKTFASFLNKGSMESSSDQRDEDKETIEMMDDLASSMLSLPVLELTLVPRDMEENLLLGKQMNLELEGVQCVVGGEYNFQLLQANSFENSTLAEVPYTTVSFGETNPSLLENSLNEQKNDNYFSTLIQSQISSESRKLTQDENLLTISQDEGLLKISQDEGLLKVSQDENLSKISQDEGLLKISQDENLVLDKPDEAMGLTFNADEERLEVGSFESNMESAQGTMSIDSGMISFKDGVSQSVHSNSASDFNHLKWENRSEIISNLRQKISILKEDEITTLQLKLYPQHLGSMSVELQMKNGILKAHVLVESSEVKSVIEQELHQIYSDGTKIEQINVEVNAQRHHQSKSQTMTKSSKHYRLDDEPVEETVRIPKEIQHIGYLNLRV